MSEWSEITLGEVIEVYDSMRVPLSSAERATRKGPYPYYGAQGIIDYIDGYIFDGRFILVPEDGENLRSRKLPIAYFADGQFWVNNHAHIIRAKPHVANDRFLQSALESSDIGPFVTGAAQPKLSQANLRRIRVMLPPLAEQVVIGSILDVLDDLIENNRRRIEVLEQMAQAIYREWFVRFRYPGHKAAALVDSPLGPVPTGWTIQPLSEVAELSGGSSLTKSSYVKSGYVAFSAAGPDGWLADFEIEGKGVVLSGVGARCGRTFRASGKWSSISNTIKILPMSGRCAPSWLYVATSDPDIWPKRGSAQPFVSINDARAVRLLVPDRDTGSAFESIAGSLYDSADAIGVTVLQLSLARDALLPKLVTGQVDVSHLDLDAVEVSVA